MRLLVWETVLEDDKIRGEISCKVDHAIMRHRKGRGTYPKRAQSYKLTKGFAIDLIFLQVNASKCWRLDAEARHVVDGSSVKKAAQQLK